MDGERERVVIRERGGWIDGWVNSTREECGGGAGGRGFEWQRNVLVTVVFCTKKNTKKTPENPIPRDFSTRVYFIMMLYTL